MEASTGTSDEHRPRVCGCQTDAGQPMPRWNSRFAHSLNRYPSKESAINPTAASKTSPPTGAHRLFVSPSFQEFMQCYFGRKPVIVKVALGHSAETEHRTADRSHAKDDWSQRAARIAARAAKARKQSRLAVVDPTDPERKTPRKHIGECVVENQRPFRQPRQRR
eukprot:m.137647 g.137647  ORF g.137647 m.137647 type:complete len:165 (+) comp17583_c0_seq27:323-817(+)